MADDFLFSSQAHVTSSDAIKNAPFILVAKSTTGAQITFKPTEEYAMTYPGTGQTPQVNVIKIPKSVFEFVDVGSYQLTEKVAHLPLVCVCARLDHLDGYCLTHIYRRQSYWREKSQEQMLRFRLPFKLDLNWQIQTT